MARVVIPNFEKGWTVTPAGSNTPNARVGRDGSAHFAGGVTIGGALEPSQLGVPEYTMATLPNPRIASAGSIVSVTDGTSGLWLNTGTQWVALNGRAVDVRMKGAIGDGTSDDTVALRSAIAAVSPNTSIPAGGTEVDARTYGGIVYIPSKYVFRFTDTLFIPSQVVLVGDGGVGMFNANFSDPSKTPGSTLYYDPSDLSHAALAMNGYVTATGAYIPADGSADALNIGVGITNGTYRGTQSAGIVNVNLVSANVDARMGISILGCGLARLDNVLIKDFKSGFWAVGSWNPNYQNIYIHNYDTTGIHIFDTAESCTLRTGWIHGGSNVGNTGAELGYVNADINGIQFEGCTTGLSLIDAFNVVKVTAAFECGTTDIMLSQLGSHRLNAINCEASGSGTTTFINADATGPDCDVLIDNLRAVDHSRVLGANMTGSGCRLTVTRTPLGASDSLGSIADATPFDWQVSPRERRLNGSGELDHNTYLPGASSTLRQSYIFNSVGKFYTVNTASGIEVRDHGTGNLRFKMNTDTPFGFTLPFGNGVYSCFGTPEGQIAATVGSICCRSDGGTGTSFYVKESGSGNTGWVAK